MDVHVSLYPFGVVSPRGYAYLSNIYQGNGYADAENCLLIVKGRGQGARCRRVKIGSHDYEAFVKAIGALA